MSQLRDDIRLLFSRSDIARFVLIVVLMLGGSLLELASLGVVPLFVALLAGGDGMESLGRLADLAKRLNFDISSVSPMTCGLLMGGLFAIRTAYLSINYYIQERIVFLPCLSTTPTSSVTSVEWKRGSGRPFQTPRRPASILQNQRKPRD